MKSAFGPRRILPYTTMVLACLALHAGESHAEAPPALLQPYAEKLEPGRSILFPTVPISLKSRGMENLVSNPGFEFERTRWTVIGEDGRPVSTAKGEPPSCFETDLLQVEGRVSLQVLPSANGSLLLSQEVSVEPRTFYTFGAYLFAPGASEAALEVRNNGEEASLSGNTLRGSMTAWSYADLTFVTGSKTEQITVGIRFRDLGEDAPILIDQCELYAPAVENLLASGTMETAPSEDQMAEWYAGGKSALAVPDGYRSEHAVELPLSTRGVSSLVGLIPIREELEGREVWISAMIKSVGRGNAPPPAVRVVLRTTDAHGEISHISTTCPGAGEWVETTLRATLPVLKIGESADFPPFHLLRFERPPGIRGRVLIDEVMMLGVPEEGFAGGLASTTQRR